MMYDRRVYSISDSRVISVTAVMTGQGRYARHRQHLSDANTGCALASSEKERNGGGEEERTEMEGEVMKEREGVGGRDGEREIV